LNEKRRMASMPSGVFFILMDTIDSDLPNAFGTFAAPIGAF